MGGLCFYLWFAIWIVKAIVTTTKTIESNSKSVMIITSFVKRRVKPSAICSFLPEDDASAIFYHHSFILSTVKGRSYKGLPFSVILSAEIGGERIA